MDLVDTHCHLHFKNFGIDNDQAYKDSVEAGVSRIICVGTTLKDSQSAIEFAKNKPGVWATAGVHPHEAEAFEKSADEPNQLAELLKQPKVVAIGEIGLDYYKSETPKLIQEKALRSQIETGLQTRLPFSFHVRDAWKDFWRILDEYRSVRGVVHSFSSGTKQLDMALSRGLLIGLNGIMTFTKDQAQLDAAKVVPAEKLLLETDAPFLTPLVHRGEVCQPKYIVDIAEFLAKLRDVSIQELSSQTTTNSIKLFNLQ